MNLIGFGLFAAIQNADKNVEQRAFYACFKPIIIFAE